MPAAVAEIPWLIVVFWFRCFLVCDGRWEAGCWWEVIGDG